MRPENWRELGFGTAEKRLRERGVRVGECLEYPGALRNGVSQIRISAGGHCWTENVQRAAYMLWVSRDIPEDQEVKRTCRNPRCIEPLHLAPGPRGAPVNEEAAKERAEAAREAAKERRLLSPRQVATIRRRVREGRVLVDLAEKYGVTHATIYAVANGFTYRDGAPIPERGKRSAYRRDAVHCNRKAGT